MKLRRGSFFQDHGEIQSSRFCQVVAAGVAAAVAVGGSVYSANAQKKAAQGAANAQAATARQAIDAQDQRFLDISEMLAPYRLGGEKALTGQMDLTGLNGNDAQSAAIQALQSSPQFTAALQQGENSILQNASATGGLRGGNTQAALAQYSPALLAQTINDQYSRLGGLTSIGQNAAAQTGNFGQQSVNNVSNLLQQQGAAYAGQALANGKANAQIGQSVAQLGSAFLGGKF